jgi:hypothetical protein
VARNEPGGRQSHTSYGGASQAGRRRGGGGSPIQRASDGNTRSGHKA